MKSLKQIFDENPIDPDRQIGPTADCLKVSAIAEIIAIGDISYPEKKHIKTCEFCNELVERSIRLSKLL